jgi:PAS domain-containing protein
VDGRILDCNDACCRILGYPSRADFLSHPERDLFLRSKDTQPFFATLNVRKALTNLEHRLWPNENGGI